MADLCSNWPFCSNNLIISSERKNSRWLIYMSPKFLVFLCLRFRLYFGSVQPLNQQVYNTVITKAFSGPARHHIIIIPKIFVRNAGQLSKLENFNYPTYLYSSHKGQLSWFGGSRGQNKRYNCKEEWGCGREKRAWF